MKCSNAFIRLHAYSLPVYFDHKVILSRRSDANANNGPSRIRTTSAVSFQDVWGPSWWTLLRLSQQACVRGPLHRWSSLLHVWGCGWSMLMLWLFSLENVYRWHAECCSNPCGRSCQFWRKFLNSAPCASLLHRAVSVLLRWSSVELRAHCCCVLSSGTPRKRWSRTWLSHCAPCSWPCRGQGGGCRRLEASWRSLQGKDVDKRFGRCGLFAVAE